ncbi:MAG: hypothetical protein IKR48_02140 [Kiritimatiellae bacterium]|nr:hypothetical protein [Kiritimatiellia bacterium]
MSSTEEYGPTYSILDYVRMRPEQIFHVLGNGLGFDDCIYQMLQIIVDNSIDEFRCGCGNQVELTVDYGAGRMSVRDYGYGTPVTKLEQCFSVCHGGGMYTSDEAILPQRFLLCAGTVNALSSQFRVRSVRNGEYGEIVFAEGKLVSNETGASGPDEKSGTFVEWIPDATVLPKFTIVEEHVIRRIRDCATANPGLTFILNGSVI